MRGSKKRPKQYRVLTPFQRYDRGDIISPQGNVADVWLRRGLIEEAVRRPRENAMRRPR